MQKEDMLYDIMDRVGKTQDAMRVILVEMQVDLKYHIKRTDLLEEQVRLLQLVVTHPFPWKKAAAGVSIIGGVIGILIKISPL